MTREHGDAPAICDWVSGKRNPAIQGSMDLSGIEAAYHRTPADRPKDDRPGWLPHGRCDGRRANATVTSLTGFMCGDIDDFDAERAGELRDEALSTGHVSFAGRSASGNGLHILVPLRLPRSRDGGMEDFARLAPLAQDWMECTLRCSVDRSCKDPARFQYLGSDPRAGTNG